MPATNFRRAARALSRRWTARILRAWNSLKRRLGIAWSSARPRQAPEVEEGDGPAHPEPENEETGTATPSTVTGLSKRSELVKDRHIKALTWRYAFKVVSETKRRSTPQKWFCPVPSAQVTPTLPARAKEFREAPSKIPTDRKVRVRIDREGGINPRRT